MHPHWLADAGEAKSIAAKAAQVVDRSGPVWFQGSATV